MGYERPECGQCGATMTPENSNRAPEMFLCDPCAEKKGYPDVVVVGRKCDCQSLSGTMHRTDCPLVAVDQLGGHDPRRELDRIWSALMQEARSCQRTWGMGFPVISTELLRKYWHEATGHLPSERSFVEIPKR